MSVEAVKEFFLQRGLDCPLLKLNDSGATVELAAKTIGVNEELIAKTLAFKVKDRNVLIVTRGDARIDNKKFKQFFNAKAKFLTHEEVSEVTGHPVGGLCPFGLKTPVQIYMDASIKKYEYVYPAAGAIDVAMKISTEEMHQLTNAEWTDVCQVSP